VPNITATQADPFVPELWAAEALNALRSNITIAKLVTRDTDVAAFTVGDKLNIPYAGTLTAVPKVADTGVTAQAPTNEATITVTLDKHYIVPIIIEDIARAQAMPSLRDSYVREAVRVLAEQIDTDLLALYATFSSTDVGTAGTDISYDTILSARQTLNTNKAPMTDRNIVLSVKDEKALLGDSDLSAYFANAKPGAVAEGAIGRLSGFDVWMSQLVPSSGGTTHNLAFQKEAIILAMRGLPQDNPGALSATMQDPLSGLVLRVTGMYNMSHVGMQLNIDVLYGVAELRDACGVEIVS